MRYRNVDRGAIDLANGSIVGPGEYADLLEKPGATKVPAKATERDRELAAAADAVLLQASVVHPHNAAYIADGVLIEAPEKTTTDADASSEESGK